MNNSLDIGWLQLAPLTWSEQVGSTGANCRLCWHQNCSALHQNGCLILQLLDLTCPQLRLSYHFDAQEVTKLWGSHRLRRYIWPCKYYTAPVWVLLSRQENRAQSLSCPRAGIAISHCSPATPVGSPDSHTLLADKMYSSNSCPCKLTSSTVVWKERD